MTIFKIPFSGSPEKFTVVLNGKEYIFVIAWNNSIFELSITDLLTSKCLVAGIPIVSGCDILEQFGHLGLGGVMFVYGDGDYKQPPNLETLSNGTEVYFAIS